MHFADLAPDPADETDDPATSVHKALRRFMFETLVRVGAVDVTDRLDLTRTVNLVQRLLGVLGEAAPQLDATMRALCHGGASQRRAQAAQLYRELSRLVNARLQRIEVDEAADMPRLSGPALHRWRQEQLAALADAELDDALHWMGESLSPQELAAFLDDLRAGSAPGRFARALDALQRQLEPTRWAGVIQALGSGGAAPATLALAA